MVLPFTELRARSAERVVTRVTASAEFRRDKHGTPHPNTATQIS